MGVEAAVSVDARPLSTATVAGAGGGGDCQAVELGR